MIVITTAWHQILADITTTCDYSLAHWWLLVIAAVLIIAMIITDITHHPLDGRSSDRSEINARSGDE
jgi:hypothetical protein